MLYQNHDMEMVVAGIVLMILALVLVAGLILAVLSALALYTIAKRREIANPWLAWIPLGQAWILGSISDQYQFVRWGRFQNRRKVLLGLGIASMVLSIGFAAFSRTSVVVSGGSESLYRYSYGYSENLISVLYQVALIGISIATAVFHYICLYNLFRSSNPRNASGFLVLSILISVTEPFLLFSNRKRDWGMPPRREQIPQPGWSPQGPEF